MIEDTDQDHLVSAHAGESTGARSLYMVGRGVAPSDQLPRDMLDILEADGQPVPATPRLKGWARRIPEAIESGGGQ